MKHEKRGAETMTVNYHRGGTLRVEKGGKITMCSGFYVHIIFLSTQVVFNNKRKTLKNMPKTMVDVQYFRIKT